MFHCVPTLNVLILQLFSLDKATNFIAIFHDLIKKYATDRFMAEGSSLVLLAFLSLIRSL